MKINAGNLNQQVEANERSKGAVKAAGFGGSKYDSKMSFEQTGVSAYNSGRQENETFSRVLNPSLLE